MTGHKQEAALVSLLDSRAQSSYHPRADIEFMIAATQQTAALNGKAGLKQENQIACLQQSLQMHSHGPDTSRPHLQRPLATRPGPKAVPACWCRLLGNLRLQLQL